MAKSWSLSGRWSKRSSSGQSDILLVQCMNLAHSELHWHVQLQTGPHQFTTELSTMGVDLGVNDGDICPQLLRQGDRF